MEFVAVVALPSELPIIYWPFEEPIVYSGVGKLNAAFTTINVIAKFQPKLILNLGTAGSLNSALTNVVEVKTVLQRDFDAEPLAPRGSVPFDDNQFWHKEIGSSHENITYISFIDSFCGELECTRWNKGWLYSDADHLSNLGAESISKLLVLHLEHLK